MGAQQELEQRLRIYAQDFDHDFPRAASLDRRIMARVAITAREERRALTLPQELALAGLVVVAVALLVIGIARVREMTQPVPAHPTPSVRSNPVPATALFPPSFPVKMVTPKVGWAASVGAVFRTTDGGLRWESVSLPSLPNGTKEGSASYFLDRSS